MKHLSEMKPKGSLNPACAAELGKAATLPELPRAVSPAIHWPPKNPPEQIQRQFVGASYERAYEEAYSFVTYALQQYPDAFSDEGKVLDFGAGWGRITRMLLQLFEPHQIWTSDIDNQMTCLIQSTLPGVNAVTNPPFPPSAFRSGMYDAAFAFSVFSHLSESCHEAWTHEFGRILKPGGKLFITLLEIDFILLVADAKKAAMCGTADGFATALSRTIDDPAAASSMVAEGKFVYARGDQDGPREKDFYGWAVAPRPWVEKHWGKAGFRIANWTPTGTLFQQAAVTLVKSD